MKPIRMPFSESTSDIRNSSKFHLWISVLAALVLFVLLERSYFYYASEHFQPVERMREALESEDHCIVVLGDSRVDGAVDTKAIVEALKTKGVDTCVVRLSFAAGTAVSQYAAFREYLRNGKHPRLVIYGLSLDTMFEGEDDDYFENGSAALLWSDWDDVSLQGLNDFARFHWLRLTSFGIFRSVAWRKTQIVQKALVEKMFPSVKTPDTTARTPQNGSNPPYAMFLERLEQLALNNKSPDSWIERAEYRQLRALFAKNKIPFVLLEIPMDPAYYKLLEPLAPIAAVRHWYRHPRDGIAPVTLIESENFTDLTADSFVDTIHLKTEVSPIFSRKLAELLEPILVDRK